MTTAVHCERPLRIVADRVTKKYRSQRLGAASGPALADASLTVHDGEFVSLVGPSGCGKTTLLKICAGLIAPTSGSIEWFGEPRPRRRFGMMVFQASGLLPWRTVADNITLPGSVLGWSRKEYKDRVAELLDTVQLPGTEKRYPTELSGGMQQRVSIARALFSDPDVLFMDEPFGALDAMTREGLNLLMQEIQVTTNKTVIFVTHNIQEAVFLSDRVVVMGARPGHVRADIHVELPRPRTLEDMVTPEFTAIEKLVRQYLDGARQVIEEASS